MRYSLSKVASLATLVLTCALASPSNAVELSKHLSTIVSPEPIVRVSPKYPINAARSGREGWAELSFVIDKHGDVSNVLVKDTSGSNDFAKEAIKAAKKWRYKPAFENGKAIQQCVNTVRMDFKMGKSSSEGTVGVSRRFITKYKKAKKALAEQDYIEVNTQLALMKKRKPMHLSEHNYMHLLASEYEKAKGNKEKQLYHLSRIAKSFVRQDDEKQELSVLYQMFILQVEFNEFRAAHNTHNRLTKLDSAKPYLSKLDKVMAMVDAAITSDEDLIRLADIKDNDFWTADLVRDEFSLTNVDGALHTLDVRCANKRHVYTIEEDNTWKLPASWEDCSIYVYGDPKTKFRLIEHPLGT